MRATIENAAELSGATVNQFILQSALREAQRLLESESIIRLSSEQARRRKKQSPEQTMNAGLSDQATGSEKSPG
jgi:uncharacterized protein (DUF1778 family)